MPGERGCHPRLRHPRRGEHPLGRRAVAVVDRLRAHPSRAGRVVHGRGLRPADRQGRGVLGDPGPRRDQPAARRRRRHHEFDSGAGAFGAGRDAAQLQGVAPERRPGVDVRTRHQVVGSGRHTGRGTGDGPQGVQARADRAARCGVPRGARGRRGSRRPRGRHPAARQRAASRRSVGGADRAGRRDPARRRAIRCCSPATAPPAAMRSARSDGSPRRSACRSRRRSTARA